LKKAQITAPEDVKAPRTARPKKDRNPAWPVAIRIYKDGSVYPSKELVEKFDLEFRSKGSAEQGKGFDIIDTEQAKQYFGQLPQRVIMACPVPRNAKGLKPDLFASTTYYTETEAAEATKESKTGETFSTDQAKSSVLTQGAVSFGKDELLPLVKEVYGVEPGEGGYIDFTFEGVDDEPLRIPANKPQIAFLPKTVSRGKEKGKPTVSRRENPEFWVLYPVPVDATAEAEEADTSGEGPGAVEAALAATNAAV
jgi:hypothetical protein